MWSSTLLIANELKSQVYSKIISHNFNHVFKSELWTLHRILVVIMVALQVKKSKILHGECHLHHTRSTFSIFFQDTFCRATRTIHPTPNTIDANMTSLVGINILDSADCVYLTPSSTNCLSASLLSDAINPSSPPILESIFDENNARYAEYDSTTFSSRVPTRFSFDFLVTTLPTDALILLYGRNSTPIDEFFWIAIEIVGLNLKFHFHNQHSLINNIELKISTWYHIECQVNSI